ncbi:WD40 repeat protein [Bradyrhizobium sp. GM24.11]
MAVATDAGPIYVFETATGTKIAELVGHTDAVKKVAFHPLKEWLLSASWDQTIRLWDVKAARTTKIFRGHQGKVGHTRSN